MTIYAKCFITTLSAMLLVNAPSNNDDALESEKPMHDVEKLITLTERDIRLLEIKIDSILMTKGDSLILNQINDGATTTQ